MFNGKHGRILRASGHPYGEQLRYVLESDPDFIPNPSPETP